MTTPVLIWLLMTASLAVLAGLLIRWIWPQWSEGQIAALAAIAMPLAMIGFGIALLVREWNVDTGGREIQTIGFSLGQVLALASVPTFLVGMVANLLLKLMRSK